MFFFPPSLLPSNHQANLRPLLALCLSWVGLYLLQLLSRPGPKIFYKPSLLFIFSSIWNFYRQRRTKVCWPFYVNHFLLYVSPHFIIHHEYQLSVNLQSSPLPPAPALIVNPGPILPILGFFSNPFQHSRYVFCSKSFRIYFINN